MIEKLTVTHGEQIITVYIYNPTDDIDSLSAYTKACIFADNWTRLHGIECFVWDTAYPGNFVYRATGNRHNDHND